MSEKPLTARLRADGQPPSLTEYRDAGGYEGLRRALGMEPGDVTQTLKDANLRGRGGAGFPTGMKWSFVPMDYAGPKYVVCNADEMEPGTFKDRLILEGDPHQMVEAMILAGYAVQAGTGYIFLRGEYHLAAQRLQHAMDEARREGLLGQNVMGSDFDFQLYLHTSAGRYICGEETALLSALQGERAVPRAKPPFPQQMGLFGRPSVVNNVETLCNVPHILREGTDWYTGISRSSDGGTKLYGASGRVKRPAVYELPMGTPMRELLEEHAGGMQDGYQFKAVLPGGASTPLLVEEHLDVALDYDSVGAAGSRLGTGTMVIIDDHTSIVGLLRNLEHFFAQESCGWCTPCRDGLSWVEKLLISLEQGRGRPGDIEVLEEHVRDLGPGKTFCAHAPGAVGPLGAALHYFRDEFEAAIGDRG